MDVPCSAYLVKHWHVWWNYLVWLIRKCLSFMPQIVLVVWSKILTDTRITAPISWGGGHSFIYTHFREFLKNNFLPKPLLKFGAWNVSHRNHLSKSLKTHFWIKMLNLNWTCVLYWRLTNNYLDVCFGCMSAHLFGLAQTSAVSLSLYQAASCRSVGPLLFLTDGNPAPAV